MFQNSFEYSSLFKRIHCVPGYNELYKIGFGSPQLIGEPILQKFAASDPKYLFTGIRGHIVLEEIDNEQVIFVTNQHLVLKDIFWIAILFCCIGILTFEVGILFGMSRFAAVFAMTLYFFYLFPLFGFAPTPFAMLDPNLDKCHIVDMPAFGLELSIRGFLNGNHFTILNDWVRLSCPINIITNQKITLSEHDLRIHSIEKTEKLGFVHISDEDWWFHRKNDIHHIHQSDNEKLKAHTKFYEEKGKTCINNPCFWEGNIVSETKFYYVMNLTMLPGHSGLSCRSNPHSKKFHGIVQSFHEGHGFNLCSKLSKESQFLCFWIIMTFWPLILTFIWKRRFYILESVRKRRLVGTLIMACVAFLIISLGEFIYF